MYRAVRKEQRCMEARLDSLPPMVGAVESGGILIPQVFLSVDSKIYDSFVDETEAIDLLT